MFWCVSFRLGAFGTVSLLHKTCCKTRQTGAINAKVRAMMSSLNFAMNAPDPHHWSLNSCFGVFLSVRVHFGPFRYYTKLGAKCAKLVQLMQKFVQRCLVRIFGTNAPDPHHWTRISFFVRFFLFGCIWNHFAIA
jgi:hypothetical protein